jgi:urea transporter
MFFSYERVSEYIPFEPRLGLFFWFSLWIGAFLLGMLIVHGGALAGLLTASLHCKTKIDSNAPLTHIICRLI